MEQNELQLIAATPLRKLLGGVSDMTLYRWEREPEFPQSIRVGRSGQRYWRMADIADWQKAQLLKSEQRDNTDTKSPAA